MALGHNIDLVNMGMGAILLALAILLIFYAFSFDKGEQPRPFSFWLGGVLGIWSGILLNAGLGNIILVHSPLMLLLTFLLAATIVTIFFLLLRIAQKRARA